MWPTHHIIPSLAVTCPVRTSKPPSGEWKSVCEKPIVSQSPRFGLGLLGSHSFDPNPVLATLSNHHQTLLPAAQPHPGARFRFPRVLSLWVVLYSLFTHDKGKASEEAFPCQIKQKVTAEFRPAHLRRSSSCRAGLHRQVLRPRRSPVRPPDY